MKKHSCKLHRVVTLERKNLTKKATPAGKHLLAKTCIYWCKHQANHHQIGKRSSGGQAGSEMKMRLSRRRNDLQAWKIGL